MKAPTPSQAKLGPFKTMPLRWSLGPREKRAGTSVELVEYLESRRRPRSTSRSIVPLLTGAASGDKKLAAPRSEATLPAKGEDTGHANGRGLAGVPCPSGLPNHHAAPGYSEGLNTAQRLKENASQDIRLPQKFDLPLTVTPSTGKERPLRPEGQKAAVLWKAGGRTGSQSSPPSPSAGLSRNGKDDGQGTLPKMRATAEARAAEKDRLPQGTFTLLRSVFWRKENRKMGRAEGSPQAPPASLGSGRLSPTGDTQARGSSPALRLPESLARGLGGHLERDICSAPSSLHLPRKAGRPPRASATGTSQRGAPGEQTSHGTLQRVKYLTLSLGRKKTLPESSF